MGWGMLDGRGFGDWGLGNNRKPRSMSTNQKEAPFKNIIKEKKENDQIEKTKLQEYKMNILHPSRYENTEQLSCLMKSEIFDDLTENEQLYYAITFNYIRFNIIIILYFRFLC